MKKNYILFLALTFSLMNVYAQLQDDFESYNTGSLPENNIWTNWSQNSSNTNEYIVISEDFASSGTKSAYIGDNSTGQDALLKLGDKVSGDYNLSFKLYIPSGKSGYFNLQSNLPANGAPNGNNDFSVFFNTNGSVSVQNPGGPPFVLLNFNFPNDQWFTVSMDISPAASFSFNGDVTITVNNSPPHTEVYSSLGGVNFYGERNNTSMYIDDINFVDNSTLTTNSFEEQQISMYPNPVENVLNVKLTQNSIPNLKVYDINGKLLLQEKTNKLETSSLSKGFYFLKINDNKVEKFVKK